MCLLVLGCAVFARDVKGVVKEAGRQDRDRGRGRDRDKGRENENRGGRGVGVSAARRGAWGSAWDAVVRE